MEYGWIIAAFAVLTIVAIYFGVAWRSSQEEKRQQP